MCMIWQIFMHGTDGAEGIAASLKTPLSGE
jgi:hypothetical protein